MVERGILHIEEDRLLPKVEDRVVRLHRHNKDHVRRFLDFHLVNAFEPHFGNEDTVFCHFGSHSTLLDKRSRASIIPHKAVGKWLLSVEHPPGYTIRLSDF